MAQVWNPLIGGWIEVDENNTNLRNTEQLGRSAIPPWLDPTVPHETRQATFDDAVNAGFAANFASGQSIPNSLLNVAAGNYLGSPYIGSDGRPQGAVSGASSGQMFGSGNMTPLYDQLSKIYGTTSDKNQQALDNLMSRDLDYTNYLSGTVAPAYAANLGQQYADDATYARQSQDLTNMLGGYARDANAAQFANAGQYGQTLDSLSSYNNGLMNNLSGLYGQMSTPLQSGVNWAGDLTSQAAGAYADPSSIAAQNNAMGFLSGAMGGSLDYQSQAAQAYADPAAIAAQWQALGQIQGAANGSLNVTSQAAQAYADPRYTEALEKSLGDMYGIAQGSKDVKPGDLDPVAYKNSLDAMNKLKELSDPRITAQEQFLFEQARLRQEQDERANRSGVMNNLRMRGMGGSGMELTDAALANQQTSQNRLLADLGALANADARSMKALEGWSGAAQGLNSQANALSVSNRNRQLQALGIYTDAMGNLRSASFDEAYKRGAARDTVEMNNMNRQLQAMGMSFDAAGNIRQQSFNEEYSRGVAADNASANNQQTRLQGGIAYGNMANTQRAQSFNESYSRGLAADNMSQYNRSQSLDVAKFNANYNANERDSLWARGQGLTQTGLMASGMNASNAANKYTANNSAIMDSYGRNKDVVGSQDLTNTRQHDNSRYRTDSTNALIGWQAGNVGDALGRYQDYTNTQMGINNQRGAGDQAITKLQLADRSAANAANMAIASAQPPKEAKVPISLDGGLSFAGYEVLDWGDG